MDDRSWIYRISLERLYKMDYYNKVESFINYALSNPRNIIRGGITCLYKRCKDKKKFLNLDVITM
jgi:hypothetical protein